MVITATIVLLASNGFLQAFRYQHKNTKFRQNKNFRKMSSCQQMLWQRDLRASECLLMGPCNFSVDSTPLDVEIQILGQRKNLID